MPYSGPSTSTQTTPTTGGRPGHYRSYSASFSDAKGPGAFAPMGSLPRRGSGIRTTPTTAKAGGPVFHINDDDEDDSSSSSESSPFSPQPRRVPAFHDSHDSDDDGTLPPLKFKQQGPFRLHLSTKQRPTVHLGVPFPKSSPSPLSPSPEGLDSFVSPPPDIVSQSPAPLPSPSVYTPSSPGFHAPPRPRPAYSRTNSTPVLLANGKPLKSSLKSSFSSPNISPPVALPQPQEQRAMHLRARSEPATPRLDLLSGTSTPSTSPGSTTVGTPKNVHFSTTDLATVRVFNKSAKPASLLGEETETETEGETALFKRRGGGYPFPRVPRRVEVDGNPGKYELDLGSYTVPSSSPPPHANVHLETLELSPSSPLSTISASLSLTGTILVRNLAFEKQVFVRFTLDDWQTTSEVSAKYVDSPATLPPSLLPQTFGDLLAANGSDQSDWDRFRFSIRLDDYMRGIESKVLWIVGRFIAPGTGEWWDNNGQRNYRVAFRKVVVPVAKENRTVSAPATTLAQPAPLKAHQLPRISTHPSASQSSPQTSIFSPSSSRSSSLAKEAISAATEKRLSKFNFGSNYARPTLNPGVSAEMLTAALQPLSAKEEEASVSKSSVPGNGITLYLPARRPTPTSSLSALALQSLDQNTLEFPTLPGSPRASSPVRASDVPDLVRRTASNLSTSTTSTDDELEELDDPSHSNEHVMFNGSKNDFSESEFVERAEVVTPKPEDYPTLMSPTAMDSESLYKAFVDRWCFATNQDGGPVLASEVGIEI